MQRFLNLLLTIGLSTLIAACGGGGGSGGDNKQNNSGDPSTAPSGDNVQPISVNGGPLGIPNLAYTNVTVCIPGTSQCQAINNVIVDTGSVGLRVLSSALNGLALPSQQLVAGHTLAECIPFLDGSYMWGPVRVADVKIAGKTASSVFIHVAAENGFGTAPATCLNNSNPLATPFQITGVNDLGANAILGIGHFREDCGESCSDPQNNYYYDCDAAASCVGTAADTTRQVQNPVAFFNGDNNGVIVQLPKVPSGGAASVDGWLIFGIGTRDNNGLASAKTFTVDPNTGNLTTTYKDEDQDGSFIDSGSNALYFRDDAITQCSDGSEFYCPNSTQHLSATISGDNGTSATISFSVANASKLNGNFYAFNNFAGYNLGDFDWGLPFFFGRKVYTAFETNAGGPYIAF